MKYEIKGGAFPVVICHLEDREKMITEKGAMVWQTTNISMDTKGGGLLFRARSCRWRFHQAKR